MFIFLIIGIVVLIGIIVSYIYRQMHYKNWQKTDEGILQANLEKLRRNPGDADSLKMASRLLYKKKQYEKAFPHYSKLILIIDHEFTSTKSPGGPAASANKTIEAEHFRIYLEFGITAYKIKRYEDALIGLKKARHIAPNSKNLGLALTLGQLLFRKELYNEAARELRIAYSKDASNPDLVYYLGICREKLGEYGNALSLLKPIESKFNKNPQFLLALAHCHVKTNDRDSAARLYKTLLSYPKMAAHASYELAMIHIAANDTTQALEYLERVPQLEQPAGELTYQALYESAQVFAKIGKLREACTPLQKLFQINPLYLETKTLLSNYKEMLKNHNLYILYYGSKVQKQKLLHQLIKWLIPNAWKIDNVKIESKTIEATISIANQQDGNSYLLWMNLAPGIVTLEKARDIIARGKQSGCSSYVLITIDSFDNKIQEFSKIRPVDLVEGSLLRSHLLDLGEKTQNTRD